MNKYIYIGIIIMIVIMISCSIKKTSIVDQINLQKVDTSTVAETKKLPIEVGDCGKIYLSDFKHLNIEQTYFNPNTFGLINCLVNYAEKGDTLSQMVLYEICNTVGDNVYKFDFQNSMDISMFLEQTLFLTPKSNKWLPVLMKYAKDDNCKKTKSGHWPSEEHFGTWVAGAIISNLSDKEYAKELGIFHGGILQEEYLRAKNKSDGCDWGRRIHKILMARLEQDYKAGKLNFE